MTDQNKYSFENSTGSSMQQIIEIILSLKSQQLIADYLHNIKRFIIHTDPKNIIKDSSTISIDGQHLTEMAASDLVTVNEFNTILISRVCQGIQNYLSNDDYFKYDIDVIRIRLADYRTIVESELNDIDLKKLFTVSDNRKSYLKIKNLLTLEGNIGNTVLHKREDTLKRICTSLSDENNLKYRSDKEKLQYFEEQIMHNIQSAINEHKPSASLSMMSLPDYKSKKVNNLLKKSSLKHSVAAINKEWDQKIINQTANKSSLTNQYIEAKNRFDDMELFYNVKKVADILSIDDDYYRISTLYSKKELKRIRSSKSDSRIFLEWPKRVSRRGQVLWKKMDYTEKFRKNTLENFRSTHTKNSTLLREDIGLHPARISSESLNTKALIGLCFWHLFYNHSSVFQLIDDLESKSQQAEKQNLLLYHQNLIRYHYIIETELMNSVLTKFIEGAKNNLKSLKSTIRQLYLDYNKLLEEGAYDNSKILQAGRAKKNIDLLNDKVNKHPLNNNEADVRDLATSIIKYHFNQNLLHNIIVNYYQSFIGHDKLRNLYQIEDKTI
ncbi:MAG TPA: hypothetical protein K8V97_01370 [Jeotgalicoccus aerolatus]|nr:hypothetical protein [Jeotgalicoccus aerolatus]